ncbi:MAG: helix-turn-helix transcriptional regulator [Clostridia bacterium]|nr:helix-turn-helix transcriptional regulator [Clostridia bacterium]
MKQRINAKGKNLIGERLKLLRKDAGLSQRDLAARLQLIGIDMDKNVITRIETNQRYVTDFELQALKDIFQVSYDYLIDGVEESVKATLPR